MAGISLKVGQFKIIGLLNKTLKALITKWHDFTCKLFLFNIHFYSKLKIKLTKPIFLS